MRVQGIIIDEIKAKRVWKKIAINTNEKFTRIKDVKA
jgi:hypothetical protein